MRKFLILLVLCLPCLAHADCKDQLAGWAQHLHAGRQPDADHSACKPWPANPAQTLAVLSLPQAGGSADQTVYDVEVLVADSASGAIIAHRYEPAAITSDAIGLSGIDLDTARYQLTPGLRAFGVRTRFEGASRVNPFASSGLSLYVLEGNTLRRVLAPLVIAQNSGDWDGNCAGTFTAVTRTLSMGAAGPGGYAALHVSEKTVDSTQLAHGEQCDTRDKPARTKNYDLGYDGHVYPVPKALAMD